MWDNLDSTFTEDDILPVTGYVLQPVSVAWPFKQILR